MIRLAIEHKQVRSKAVFLQDQDELLDRLSSFQHHGPLKTLICNRIKIIQLMNKATKIIIYKMFNKGYYGVRGHFVQPFSLPLSQMLPYLCSQLSDKIKKEITLMFFFSSPPLDSQKFPQINEPFQYSFYQNIFSVIRSSIYVQYMHKANPFFVMLKGCRRHYSYSYYKQHQSKLYYFQTALSNCACYHSKFINLLNKPVCSMIGFFISHILSPISFLTQSQIGQAIEGMELLVSLRKTAFFFRQAGQVSY